jgi:hypothetical protein
MLRFVIETPLGFENSRADRAELHLFSPSEAI